MVKKPGRNAIRQSAPSHAAARPCEAAAKSAIARRPGPPDNRLDASSITTDMLPFWLERRRTIEISSPSGKNGGAAPPCMASRSGPGCDTAPRAGPPAGRLSWMPAPSLDVECRQRRATRADTNEPGGRYDPGSQDVSEDRRPC